MGGLMYFETLAVMLSEANDEQRKAVYNAILRDIEDMGLRILPFISDNFDNYFNITASQSLETDIQKFALISAIKIARVISDIYETIIKLVPYHRRKINPITLAYFKKAADIYNAFNLTHKDNIDELPTTNNNILGKFTNQTDEIHATDGEKLAEFKYVNKTVHVLDNPDNVKRIIRRMAKSFLLRTLPTRYIKNDKTDGMPLNLDLFSSDINMLTKIIVAYRNNTRVDMSILSDEKLIEVFNEIFRK